MSAGVSGEMGSVIAARDEVPVRQRVLPVWDITKTDCYVMSAGVSGERESVGARGEVPVRQRVLPVWGHHHKNRLLRYVSCGEWREGVCYRSTW